VSLTAADVAEIMRLLEQSSFDELTLELNGVKLSLRRSGAPERAVSVAAGTSAASGVSSASGASCAPSVATASTQANNAASAARASAAPAPAPGEAATRADPTLYDVPSPLLGTFYRAPRPGAPAFVEVGSPVEENTIVAIIEVMKLMNTVRAGARGTVTEIIPGDGTLVEYDQPILRIRKTA
jgi:acetyl-CoA carboxylase biotin carboxyl carrier protein